MLSPAHLTIRRTAIPTFPTISSRNDAGLISQPAPSWATLVATLFGVGRLRPAPGTWGSLVTALLWWSLASLLPPAARTPVLLLLIIIVVAVGVPAATLEARGCGRKDPSHVVIDEVAGQLVTLIACPIGWQALLAGFILFRGLDIVKPPPVRSLERLPEGIGIVVDDLGAGVYALIILQLLLHFRALH
jgi:phosphatidylglycerophosphatase A